MTPSERRIRTEVRFWAFVIISMVGVATAAATSSYPMAVVALVGSAITLGRGALMTHRELQRLDAEAKQEEEWS